MPEPEYDENGYAILPYPEETPPLHYEEGEDDNGYVLETGRAINITTTGVGLTGMSVEEMQELKSLILDVLKQLQKVPEEEDKIGFKP